MCNLYSMTENRAAIVALAKAMEGRNNNQPPMTGVFPDYAAPVVLQEGTWIVRVRRLTVRSPSHGERVRRT